MAKWTEGLFILLFCKTL